MAETNPTEIIAAWETSSQYWNKHQALIEKMFAPLSAALVEDAAISAGQSVLDVGGGSGEPTLTIASVVGELGHVTYSDPSAGMVKAATDRAAMRGLKNISFHQCGAQSLPFADDSFDAAVSRLSAMFFPDTLAGLREMLRVTRSAGRVSFVVWAEREVNPFFRIVTEVLDKFVPPEEEDEDAPGAFRFARPGKLSGLLERAGAVDVKERPFAFRIKAEITPERFWELRSEMSDTFRNKLKMLSAEQAETVKKEVLRGVAGYFRNDQMDFPGEALVVTGSKR